MSKRLDEERVGAPCDYIGAVRGIRLRRRRSRVPWIYLVYHARTSRAVVTSCRERRRRS